MKKRAFEPWVIPAAASVPVLILALMLIAAALTGDGSDYFIPGLKYGAVFEPSSFTIFGISMYVLMQIVGVILGSYTVIKNHKLFLVSIKQAIILLLVFYIQAVIGFKLLYAIQICIRSGDFRHWDFQGASVYGAFFGAIIVAIPTAKIMKIRQRDVADVFSIAGIIYLAFGRLGCFFGGCCGSKLYYVGMRPMYVPIQLIEVFFDLVIAAFLFAECVNAREKGKYSVGAMPPVLIMYATVRFFLEFMRTNPVLRIGITEAQVHSLLLIVVGFCIAAYVLRRDHHKLRLAPKRKPGVWLIPALLSIPVAVLALSLVIEALSSDGSAYTHALVGYGGTVVPIPVGVLGLKLYDFIEALGAAAGVTTAVFYGKKKGIDPIKTLCFAVSLLLLGFAGGKVLYAIETIYDIGHFRIKLDGQSLFGVLYFAVIFTPLFAAVYGLKRRRAYDIAAVMWLVCLCVARFGCVLSGCCGGKTFMVGPSPVTIPVQFMEIFFELLILAYCLYYTGKERKNGDRYLGGFPIFLMGYSVVRFLLEFLRTNPVTALGTTEAQKHAALLFVIGLIMALRAKPYEDGTKKKKTRKK